MADIKNPSYEDPGSALGQADQWTESYPVGSEDVAQFNEPTRAVPFERFEAGWDSNEDAQTSFGITDTAAALFEEGSHPQDGFEYSWMLPALPVAPLALPRWNHNSKWVLEDSNFDGAWFDVALETAEDFNEEWGDNETSVADLNAATTTFATFTDAIPEDVEDFDEDWQSNETSETGFAPLVVGGGTLSPALFDAGANAYENFAGTWTMTLP